MRAVILILAALTLSGCGAATAQTRSCAAIGDVPVRLPGGTFLMGDDAAYAEEGPVRRTRVKPFAIDRHEVTNQQFAAFVAATGYVTDAERPVDTARFAVPIDRVPAAMRLPGAAVFIPPERPSTDYTDWWRYVPGAMWRRPDGPRGRRAQPSEPVVVLDYADMAAYARWRGGRLPSEAEWEYAARGGGPNSRAQPTEANSWQGAFPMVNTADDGFAGIAPVGCYRPNGFGLYDMVGNVWEMTADFYRAGHDPADTDDPHGPVEAAALDPGNPGFASRVIKGGSYLCAPNYCQRYRPAARSGRDTGLGSSNVGFRLAYDDRTQ